MNIPNVNPKPTSQAAPPLPAAPSKKPAGPIMEQRKVAAAQKGMVVDARLYGVKPMALAKFINDTIKPSPFNGIIYNQKMMAIATTTLTQTKVLSSDVKNILMETAKIRTGLGSAFGKLLGMMEQGNVISERTYRDSKTREQTTNIPYQSDPNYQQREETNEILKKILEEGIEEKKKAEKKGGGFVSGLMGFLKNPLKFIWDMAGSVPFGRLILGGLTSVGIGYLLTKLFKNTGKALYDVFVPRSIKKFIEGTQGFFEQMGKEGLLNFLGNRIGQTVGLVYDWFKDDFIKPITQTIFNMAEDVGWYMGHIWDMVPKILGGQGLSAEQVGSNFDKMKKARSEYQAYEKGLAPKNKKTFGDIWMGQYDAAGNKVGDVRTGTTPLSKTATMTNVLSYDKTIKEAADKYGVDVNLIRSVIAQESQGDKNAYNKNSGAAGLMQFIPSTAKEYELNPYDPIASIDKGTKKLKGLIDYYHGDVNKALAGYNWGEGNLNKYGMNALPDETQNYIAKITQYQSEFKELGEIPPAGYGARGGWTPWNKTPGRAQSSPIDLSPAINQLSEASGQSGYQNPVNDLLKQIRDSVINGTDVNSKKNIITRQSPQLLPVYN